MGLASRISFRVMGQELVKLALFGRRREAVAADAELAPVQDGPADFDSVVAAVRAEHSVREVAGRPGVRLPRRHVFSGSASTTHRVRPASAELRSSPHGPPALTPAQLPRRAVVVPGC